jgi:hypothetical protein
MLAIKLCQLAHQQGRLVQHVLQLGLKRSCATARQQQGSNVSNQQLAAAVACVAAVAT